ncbi:MAG: hypothetical protein ACKVOJ_09500 [Sphingomonadaceae bacterium]
MNRAEDALRRHGMEPRMAQRARARARASVLRKMGRIALAGAAFAIGLVAWGLIIGPVGVSGLMIAVLAFIVVATALMIIPARSFTPGDVLPTTELALLPLKTEEWLAGQRRALPAPAIKLVDGIGLKLEQLAPQLEGLSEQEPAAAEIKRLIGDELPALVNGYLRVPPAFRAKGINGVSPDQQVVDGLAVVQSELTRMSEQLASGELTKLATQGRYLELKYQGDISA